MSASASEKKTVAEEPMEIMMTGYEVVEKMAKKCATSARILVPAFFSWNCLEFYLESDRNAGFFRFLPV